MQPYNSNTWLSNQFPDYSQYSYDTEDENDNHEGGIKRLREEELLVIDNLNISDDLKYDPSHIVDDLKNVLLERLSCEGMNSMSQVNKIWLSFIKNKIIKSFPNHNCLKNLINELKARIVDYVYRTHCRYKPPDYLLLYKINRTNFQTLIKLNDQLNDIDFLNFFDALINPFVLDQGEEKTRNEIISKIKKDFNTTVINRIEKKSYDFHNKDVARDEYEIHYESLDEIREWLKLNSSLLNYTKTPLLRIVSPEIKLLKNLKELEIDNKVPDEIVEMNSLKHLTVRIVEVFPKQIFELKNLKSLNTKPIEFYSNIREVSREIGNLKNLSQLILSRSKVECLPEEIGNLSMLKVLCLDHNKISALPLKIWTLTNLENLDVSHNKLFSISCDIKNLVKLKIFLYQCNPNLVFLPPTKVWESLSLTDTIEDIVGEARHAYVNEYNFNTEQLPEDIIKPLIAQSDELLKQSEWDFENDDLPFEAAVIIEKLNDLIEELSDEEEFSSY